MVSSKWGIQEWVVEWFFGSTVKWVEEHKENFEKFYIQNLVKLVEPFLRKERLKNKSIGGLEIDVDNIFVIVEGIYDNIKKSTAAFDSKFFFIVEARAITLAKNIQLLLIGMNKNAICARLVTVNLDEEIIIKDKINVHYQAEHFATS